MSEASQPLDRASWNLETRLYSLAAQKLGARLDATEELEAMVALSPVMRE